MSTQVHLPSQLAAPPVRVMEADAINACYFAGDGLAIRRLRSQLQRIAPYFRMALITGEAGTGKETVARALHERSAGAGGPFVAWRAAEFAEKLVDDGAVVTPFGRLIAGPCFWMGLGRCRMRSRADCCVCCRSRRRFGRSGAICGSWRRVIESCGR